MEIKQLAEKIFSNLANEGCWFSSDLFEDPRDDTEKGRANREEILKAIESILTAELGWVPVGERLPEHSEQLAGVLIQFRCGKVIAVGMGKHYKGEWTGEVGNELKPDGIIVTHWQPLPEPAEALCPIHVHNENPNPYRPIYDPHRHLVRTAQG